MSNLSIFDLIITKERGTVRPRVRSILYNHPDSRNDDDILTRLYLEQYHNLKLTDQQFQALKAAPPIESICRRRREIQNTDKDCLPNKTIGLRRKQAEKANYQIYSSR